MLSECPLIVPEKMLVEDECCLLGSDFVSKLSEGFGKA